MSRNAKSGGGGGAAKAAKAAAAAAPVIPPADLERKESGVAFCMQKGTEAGWFTLPSGIVFHIAKLGRQTADQHCPGPNDTCAVHYRGTFIDGTKFDSSYDRGQPSNFKPSQVIKGWGEVLQYMGDGDVWDVVIPWHQAYGANGTGQAIPPYAALCFTIELKMVMPQDPPKGKTEPIPLRPAAEGRELLVGAMEVPFEQLAAVALAAQ